MTGSSLLVAVCLPHVAFAAEQGLPSNGDGKVYAAGVATPIDLGMKRFYIRTSNGNVEVAVTDKTTVGVLQYVRDLSTLRTLDVKVGKKVYSFDMPEQLYAKFHFADWQSAQRFLREPDRYRKRHVKYYASPLPDHLPTENELWSSGKLTFKGKDPYIQIADKEVKLSWQEANCGYLGGNQFPFMDVLTTKDLKPLIQNMVVFGRQKGHVLEADEIAVEFRPDPRESEDPALPRVLFIGDSISGNYDRGFRGALEGRANVHHPPANCGPASKGRGNILTWLGAYDQPGHKWDVISFNFGQWDVKTSKVLYQRDLRAVTEILVKTKARLIWVNTTPIPGGYGDIAGRPQLKGREGPASPGKFKGVMRDYINPWALEVMKDYPQISICDQHAMLWNEASAQTWLKTAGTNRRGGIVNKEIKEDYGDNHIPGHLSILIGRQLARLVLDANGRKDVSLNPVEINPNDFGPKGRAVSRNMDAADFRDLVHGDERLRRYNTTAAAKE